MGSEVKFPLFKPPVHMTIDDRALMFDGTFPDRETIEAFRPWNKKDGVPPARTAEERAA